MIFIGVGSSIGNAEAVFLKAKAYLETQGIKVVKSSNNLVNAPYGGVAKNQFNNAVWQLQWPESRWEKINWCLLPLSRRQRLKAQKLLKHLKACEQACGRTAAKRWDDRVLDLDILAFNQLQYSSKKLQIPHPEIPKRRFVLEPWAEIVEKDFSIPRFGRITKLLKALR